MTIDGNRPYLGPDETYEKQRKDRMGDAIFEYLSDDNTSARQCYEEMLVEIEDIIKYHEKFLNNAVKLKELMMGHRFTDLEDYDPETLCE